MAPAHTPHYSKDEKVLCFHHELLYEAKVLDYRLSDPNDKKSPYEYRVHYKGWKATWDDWVNQDRMRRDTAENRDLQRNLKSDFDMSRKAATAPKSAASHRKKAMGSDLSSGRGSEDRHSSVPAGGRGTKRGRDLELEKEDTFYTRPSIRIVIPDNLKSILVDDWEYVTKNMQLVQLPSEWPVNKVLDTYFDEEKGKRRLGSAEADILEEVVAGCKEYFDRTLGKLLLYRFEREQYSELRQQWEADEPSAGPGDYYGPEHLVRMIVQMPELIAQTNMDQQSVLRLREELSKLTLWLAKNSTKFFTAPYENPAQDYIIKSRHDFRAN